MNRRIFLAGTAGLAVAACATQAKLPSAAGGPAQPADEAPDLETAAMEAWIYGLMLIENAASRAETLAQVAPNTLLHAYDLTTPKTQFVTTPNNDTLYSRVWIDLSGGPVTLDFPATGKRYVSYAFMDMYGTNFAILGTRTTGGEAQRVTLIGPQAASSDPLALRAPTPWVWLLIRVLIDGDADKAAANAVQDAIRVSGPARSKPPAQATRDAPWGEYFASVQALLAENPPPVSDTAFFQRVARLGLGPLKGFDAARFSSAEGAQIEAGVAKGRAAVSGRRSGQIRNSWLYPRPTLGDFEQDYLYRGQVAIGGLAALKPVEAMYMRPISAGGQMVLDSAQPWLLRFETGQLPPVHAFWSLTAYERTPAGQFYFFENAIDRYAIGDRTPGLVYSADGSLEILIQRDDPGGARRANWLPAPPAGPLGLNIRAYLPKPELMDGAYLLPALRAA
jgi:hypothetical protein